MYLSSTCSLSWFTIHSLAYFNRWLLAAFIIHINIPAYFYIRLCFVYPELAKKEKCVKWFLCSTDRYKVMKVETWFERLRALWMSKDILKLVCGPPRKNFPQSLVSKITGKISDLYLYSFNFQRLSESIFHPLVLTIATHFPVWKR